MKLGLINSAWLGSPVGTEEGIRRTKEIGFDAIDIFTDPFDIDVRERRLIKETARDVGLPIVSLPCVALGLIDFNASVRKFHHIRTKRYLDLVYELEARNLVLVLGEYVWQKEVIHHEEQWKWGVEEVRRLGEYAARLDVEIALELEPFKLSLLNDLKKLKRFLDDVNQPAVVANIDVSHLALVHARPEELLEFRGRIAHAHFSDCDGKIHGDLPPGRGVVNFPPYLKALRNAGFDGTLSIELEYSPEPGKIAEWVTEAYRETDKIMRSLRLRS